MRSPFSPVLFSLAPLLLTKGAWAAEDLKMWASTSTQINLFSKIAKPFAESTGIRIEILDNRRVSGPQYMMDVVRGNVELATNSVFFDDWVRETREANPDLTEEKVRELTQRTIGHDLLSIFCNKANGVSAMTIDQIREVFGGTAKNWKSLGGAELPIKIIFPFNFKISTRDAFRRAALRGAEIGAERIEAPDFEQMITLTSKTPGACSFGASGTPSADLVTIKAPTIGRPSVLIALGKPSPRAQKLIDFIRLEGAKYGVAE